MMYATTMAAALQKWATAHDYIYEEELKVNSSHHELANSVDAVVYLNTTKHKLGRTAIVMAHFSDVHIVDIYKPTFGDNQYHWQCWDMQAETKMLGMLEAELARMASGKEFMTMTPLKEFK